MRRKDLYIEVRSIICHMSLTKFVYSGILPWEHLLAWYNLIQALSDWSSGCNIDLSKEKSLFHCPSCQEFGRIHLPSRTDASGFFYRVGSQSSECLFKAKCNSIDWEIHNWKKEEKNLYSNTSIPVLCTSS